MTKSTDTKQQIWTALFIVTPVTILSRLSENFSDSSSNIILFAGGFGGLGGLVGWAFYFLVKNKTTSTKIISLTVLLGLCLATIMLTSNVTKPELTTCDICGYMTLKPTDTTCDYCGNETWDEKKKIGEFASKQDWIKSGQLFWYSIDSLNENIEFYTPPIDDGFTKDKTWQPLVSEQDIKDQFLRDK
jgi:hypothetical protein